MTNPAQPPTIKIIGLGGGGSNAIDRMMQIGIVGVDYIAANTDIQALARTEAPAKIHLGPQITRGLGAGGKPKVGAHAAKESYDRLLEALHDADMVFLTAGMGGGTGTGAIAIAAQAAREAGALTLAVVTLPFTFEGTTRARNAQEGIAALREHVHTLITVPNDRLLECTPRSMGLDIAFRVADDVLRQGVQGIAELVTRTGLINLDFAHIRRLIQMSGGALLSMGQGKGENRAVHAARNALNHPLLDIGEIANAAGVLVHFTGGPDMGLFEIHAAVDLIRAEASPDAELLFGATLDAMMEDRVQTILVATGVGTHSPSLPAAAEDKKEATQVTRTYCHIPKQQDYYNTLPKRQLVATAPERDSLDVPAFLRRRVAGS